MSEDILTGVDDNVPEPTGGAYTTLSALKARLEITDTVDDTRLTAVIAAASRAIDRFTGRRFYSDGDVEARFYNPPRWGDELPIDDVTEVASVVFDSVGDRGYATTLASSDYELGPYNALEKQRPFMSLQLTPLSSVTWPSTRKSVKIVGTFGWTVGGQAPVDVQEACLLWCERLHRRKDAPFGIVTANVDMGSLRVGRMDPDVKAMLDPFVKDVC